VIVRIDIHLEDKDWPMYTDLVRHALLRLMADYAGKFGDHVFEMTTDELGLRTQSTTRVSCYEYKPAAAEAVVRDGN